MRRKRTWRITGAAAEPAGQAVTELNFQSPETVSSCTAVGRRV
nr:hypothetical protein [Citrobacter freundii]